MNYGFIIDNRKCIGCHPCTVACKSEHSVPLGVNRTWVKYVEKGRNRRPVTALAIALAVAMGVTQGLLGAGGSILSIPILRYVAGLEPKQTIGVSLAVVAATSLIGAWSYWRVGYVRPRIAIPFAVLSMGAAFAGARLARHLDGRAQLLLFSVLTLSAAVSMLRRRIRTEPAPASPFGSSWSGLALFGVLALAIGLLTGVAGIGGGFLIVPGLIAVAGLSVREAAGTSFVATMLNCAAGLLGYYDQFVMPWGLLTLFTFAAAAGTLGGTTLARFADPLSLRRAFAVLLLAVGAAMAAEHWDAVAEWRGGAQSRYEHPGYPPGPAAVLAGSRAIERRAAR